MKRVIYKKVINENKENRTEFLLINFDYEEGNDYLAKIFNKEFNMKVEEKKDYIWFSIIKLCKKNTCYELLWHEDIGNIIYSLEQDEDTVNELELRLQKVLDVLNIKILESNQSYQKFKSKGTEENYEVFQLSKIVIVTSNDK